jgi:hypothetical protein
MASQVMVPQTASGTSWVNPNNALANDTANTRYPKSGAANNLKLTNLTNRSLAGTRDIVGVEVALDAFTEGLAGQLGDCSRTAAANIDLVTGTTSLTTDGNLSTYYGDAVDLGVTTSLTVIHDFGTPVAINFIRTKYYVGGFSAPVWDYSDDGFNWTTVPFTLPGPLGPGDTTFDSQLSSATTARYWRFTVTDGTRVRCYNFVPYTDTSGTTAATAVAQSGSLRFEVALTKDGTTPAGTWQPITLSTTEATYTVGGPTDLIGSALTQSEVAASTFGALVRRADALSGENTTTWRAVEFLQLTVYHNPSGGSLMPDRVSEVQLSILGKETTRGTGVTPTRQLKSTPIMLQPMVESKVLTFQGDRGDGDHISIKESVEGSIDGDPTFDEIGVHLASIIGKPVTTSLGSGAFRHEFILNTLAVADPQTYTLEYGDANVAERVTYAVMTALNLTASRSENKLAGKYIAQRIADNTNLTAGSNEVQTLTLGTATTQKLRFGGYETTALTTAGLNAAAIQSALQALTSVGAGGFVVSGTGPYVITAGAGLAGKPLPLIEVSSFSGGSTPTLVRTTPGGYTTFAIEPIAPSNWSVYYSASQATLGSNKLSMLFDVAFNVENMYGAYWTLDAANNSWKNIAEAPMRMTAKFSVQADQSAQVLVTDHRNRTQKYARLEAVGAVIGGGFSNQLTIDLSCKVEKYENFKDADGLIFAREFSLYSRYDPAWGASAKFVLINTVTTY